MEYQRSTRTTDGDVTRDLVLTRDRGVESSTRRMRRMRGRLMAVSRMRMSRLVGVNRFHSAVGLWPISLDLMPCRMMLLNWLLSSLFFFVFFSSSSSSSSSSLVFSLLLVVIVCLLVLFSFSFSSLFFFFSFGQIKIQPKKQTNQHHPTEEEKLRPVMVLFLAS